MTHRSLVRLTLLYLALPHFIFLGLWLNPLAGLPAAAALLAGLVAAWRATGAIAREEPVIARRVLVCAVIVAAFMTLVSGASGVVHQAWDWEKHNAVLHDLARDPWPVAYVLPGGERYHLLYYLAYYLPSGLAAKLAGAAAGRLVLGVSTWLGTGLALLWFARMVGARPALSIVLFPLLGGLDLAGYLILHGGWPSWFQNIEAWLPGYVNFANLMLHIWSPQHSLTVWLGAPLILFCAERARLAGVAVLGWALLLDWSSLVFASLAVVLAAALLVRLRQSGFLRDLFSRAVLLPAAAAAAVLFVEALYLSNGIAPIAFSWLPEHVALAAFLPKLLLFYLVEFGLYFLLLPGKSRLDSRQRFLATLALAVLIIAPWLHFGLLNDLAARMTHVGQYLFWAVLLAGLWRALATAPLARSLPLLSCLAVGAMAPLWQLQFILRATALDPHPAGSDRAVPELQPTAAAAQYLGRTDSWRWRLLGPAHLAPADLTNLADLAPGTFSAPFLLFNFHGQGIERDASGWWMWNRDTLDLSYVVQDPALAQEHRLVAVSFELVSAERARTVELSATGTAPLGRSFLVPSGKPLAVDLPPVAVTKTEITLSFATAGPPTPRDDDPHRREFAVRNLRFRLVPR
ncbi:MAG TPA: hypothetical protein VHE13_10470 [Opitutus sp.]|nr:hypothetical protein [Opitutus sp.]